MEYKVTEIPYLKGEDKLENLFDDLVNKGEEAKKLGILNLNEYEEVQKEMEAKQVRLAALEKELQVGELA
eukprot:4007-Eustigmatos_ZCMA.PRE.1